MIVDGVVGPWFLGVYRSEAARIGVPLDYVVLRPSLEIAVTRARERLARPIAAYPPNIYAGFTDLGALEGHAIDTGAASEVEVMSRLEAGVGEGRFRVG